MNASPSVGVVIPTYERVEQTVRAVASVCAQTVSPEDVVVVDDGSHPTTVEALTAQLRAFPARLIAAPRSAHPGRVRNLGVAELRTDWVAFLDSDDMWHPQKLARQLELGAEAGAGAVCSNARRTVDGRAEGDVVAGLPATLTLRELLSRNMVVNSTVLLRRDVLDDVGGVASSYLVRGCEDYATWLRVASRHQWAAVREPLVDYADDPSTSIRGAEEFAVHPGQRAAWLDYVIWRRETGEPLRLAERLLSGVLRRALIFDTCGGMATTGHARAAITSAVNRRA